jgi:putative transposase
MRWLVVSSGEQIHIIKHLDLEELNQRIKTEKDAKILRRLYFIKFRYEEDTIHEAAQRIGVTNRVGYIWQERWNQKGYEGLIPQYAGGRPSKLTDQQKVELEHMLRQKDLWTSKEVHDLILDKFGVDYTIKQVLVIAKKMNMKFAKPYQRDYRRPEDAEDILKKTFQR